MPKIRRNLPRKSSGLTISELLGWAEGRVLIMEFRQTPGVRCACDVDSCVSRVQIPVHRKPL